MGVEEDFASRMAKSVIRERRRKRAPSAAQETSSQADPMSQCVALCQEQRWREAVLLCRQVRARAGKNRNSDAYASLSAALLKLEYSLRRQMTAGLIGAAQDLLAKEFLLDVGEQ